MILIENGMYRTLCVRADIRVHVHMLLLMYAVHCVCVILKIYVVITKPSVAVQSTYDMLLNCSQNILVATH